MSFDNRKLTLIWEDILQEHGGEETVNAFKKEYSTYSIDHLLKVIRLLLNHRQENHACKYKVFIRDFLKSDEYTIVYSETNINYKELLVSLTALMFLINYDYRTNLIIDLAKALHNFDREVSDQFANDIAEEVYRLNS